MAQFTEFDEKKATYIVKGKNSLKKDNNNSNTFGIIKENDYSPRAILQECITIMEKKSQDYQNPNSDVVQADYYPRGVQSIYDILNAKMLRIKSMLQVIEGDPNYEPNYESLEDSFRDMINYCSFATSWLRGGINGQTSKDPLNRK